MDFRIFYHLIVCLLAIIVPLLLFSFDAPRKGLKRRVIIRAGGYGILGALMGGHILYVLTTTDAVIQDPLLILLFLDGDKSVYGAFWGAGLLGLIYLKSKKARFLTYADTAVPAIALGYAIARIGCFLNGDDFGTLSDLPWAVQFPKWTLAYHDHLLRGWIQAGDNLSLPVHPTQLYHAAAGLILFLILRKWKGKWVGSRFALAIASYGAIRFFLQFFRGDANPIIGFLDINQIFSLVFIIFAGLFWWYKRAERTQSKEVIRIVPSISS